MKRTVTIATTVLLAASTAYAQRSPEPAPAELPSEPQPADAEVVQPDGTTPVDGPIRGDEITPPQTPADPYAAQPAPKRKAIPRPPISMPEVLTTQTGWLLPAAVLYSRTAIDTGGGVSSDHRVGLGDVAEFGLATIDSVRERDSNTDKSVDRIQPYVLATFRLGVGEDRLFEGMPGVTLGFRKSFERNHDGYKTRIAELTLVASKHLGDKAAIHVGGAFWDASLVGNEEGAVEYAFNEGNVGKQLRPFGGIEVTPLKNSQILVDLGWAPEFCYECTNVDKIKLKPTLSWGVRYRVAEFMNLEAGVRVPDIASANLLEANIFGQVTFTSWALRRAVDSLK